MEVLQNIPGSRANMVEDPVEMGALMNLFTQIQEEGQEIAQEGARDGESWVAAVSWSTIIGAMGTLVLIGYLLWKLYRNCTHTKIKLCVELGSTSKTITLLVIKLPGAPANYHIRTEGLPVCLRTPSLHVISCLFGN